MRRLAYLLALLLSLPAAAAAQGTVQPLPLRDTVGTSGTLAAFGNVVKVALAGQRTALFRRAAGTFDGTVVPECSQDNEASYEAGQFYDGPSATVSLALVTTGPTSAETTLTVVCGGGATHAQVRVTVANSGTATGSIRAVTAGGPQVMMGAGGIPTVRTTAPSGTDPGFVVWVQGASPGGASITDNSLLTVGVTAGNQMYACRQDTPGAIGNNNAGCVRMTPTRDLRVAAVTSAGADATDTNLNGNRVVVVNAPVIAGQTSATTAAMYEKCETPANIKTTTAGQVLQAVGLATSQVIRFCNYTFWSDGDTNIEIVAGTGVNCVTGQTTIFGPYPLSAANGRAGTFGSAIGGILFSPISQAICIKSSAAVNLTFAGNYVRY